MKLPWFPFYGRDFFFDERCKLFTLRQHGIYLFLLWHQWEEGSIPCLDICQRFPSFVADPQATDPDSIKDVEIVHLSCFQKHPLQKSRFYNARLEVIRAEQEEKTQKIHDRAVKGGLAKAQLKQSLSMAQAEHKQTLSIANQSQKQIEKKSLKSPDHVSHGFGEDDADRTAKGLERLGGGDFLKTVQGWKKEIP